LLDTKTIDIADRDFTTRVIRVIASQDEEIERNEIIPETTLKSLGFDSFGLVSLMFALEEEFQLEITDEMLSGIRTVGDIVAGLHRLCGPRVAKV
jgi:acyl carrier protein